MDKLKRVKLGGQAQNPGIISIPTIYRFLLSACWISCFFEDSETDQARLPESWGLSC